MTTSSPAKPRAHLLHGFNVRDSGAGTVNRLAPALEAAGYEVIMHDFGWRGLLGVRFFNCRRVAQLAAQVDEGDIAIGHSDGCNIINSAAHYGARFRRVVYINPALDADTPLADHIDAALVFADRRDWAVRFSSWLPWHRWGRMGAKGPTTDPDRYATIYHDYGHSGIFKKPERLKKLAADIVWFLELDIYHVRLASTTAPAQPLNYSTT